MLQQQSQSIRFVESHSQVYYDNFHNRLSADFQSRVLLFRGFVTVFDKTTNYDFILLRMTYQRHFATSAENVWNLVQSDQSHFQ